MMEITTAIEAIGFPAIVGYLLWERSRFNAKFLESLREISVTLKNVNDHIIRRF